MTDERLKKPTHAVAESHAPRAMESRAVVEDRQLTDDDRLQILSSGFLQTKLPNLPELPGYHVCWLSTTNASDTISWRQQLGYELLKPAEVPGWRHGNCRDELYGEYVGMHEMVGAKIRLDLYHRIMQHMHHDEPTAMEAGIKAGIDELSAQVAEAGARVEQEEGTAELGRFKPAPAQW